MKAVVLAYNNIGCAGIKALIKCDYEIEAVFTYVDDINENTWFDSVSKLCAESNINTYAPQNINDPYWVNMIKDINPDIIFSFYYRDIIKDEILSIPKYGCINLHGSLLPKYRGCAPINWAIINGEEKTGITLHYMDSHADTGDIIAQKEFEITPQDTAKDLNLKATKYAYDLLCETLPSIASHTNPRIKQDNSNATYYGKRTPKDGLINWNNSATQIRNLIRAVTNPYPGAFTYLSGKKIIIWSATVVDNNIDNTVPGTVISEKPLIIACKESALRIDTLQYANGVFQTGETFASQNGIKNGMQFDKTFDTYDRKRVFIIGVNGFIGNAITQKLLSSEKYEVFGIDLYLNNLEESINNPHFHPIVGDITKEHDLIEYYISNCDIVLPLAAIATPAEYIRNTLRIFELDFEENLFVVRLCAKYNVRVIFPSTSETYGKCPDEVYDENTSDLVLGPVDKKRWIYSCSKQMLDRVITANNNLQYTIFRPFNWMGPKLDSLEKAKTDRCRAITKMVYNLVNGEPIVLIDGGKQRRCFSYLDDNIECLFRIIENKDNLCDNEIINIGNPNNDYSVLELAEMVTEAFKNNPLHIHFPDPKPFIIQDGEKYYGVGYEDCKHRIPSVKNALRCCNWTPTTSMKTAVEKTVDFFMHEALNTKN